MVVTSPDYVKSKYKLHMLKEVSVSTLGHIDSWLTRRRLRTWLPRLLR